MTVLHLGKIPLPTLLDILKRAMMTHVVQIFVVFVGISLPGSWGGESAGYNYAEVLSKSILFYEAQRSGIIPDDRVLWRGDSAINDGSDVGVDLSGGWYDAGDMVKFGMPMAWSATVLLWGAIDCQDAYSSTGLLDNFQDMIRWPLDYFIKAHPSPNVFYVQVGDGDVDHGSWGRPEDMTMSRPTSVLNTTCPGSDVAGLTASALAAGAIFFQSSDPTYATELLDHAKTLYDFGYNYQGLYHTCTVNGDKFYKSGNTRDELCLGGAWLYRATGDSTYLTKALEFYRGSADWAFSWDSSKVASQLLLYQLTGEGRYKTSVETYLTRWMPGGSMPSTPLGLVFRLEWGSLRYAANSAFIALLAAKEGIMTDTAIPWSVSQIGYMLGDTGRSFVVGFGTNPPVRPHHRASSCPDLPDSCGWAHFNADAPNPQTLYGALVGGPDANDVYIDDRTNFQTNEVACDYNAGFQSAIAAIIVLT